MLWTLTCQVWCTWVPGRWGLSPCDLLQTLKSNTAASQSRGAGSSPASRRAPGHSLSGPREAPGPPDPPTLLPRSWFVLARASAKSKFTPVRAGNPRLFPITYSLAFHFKITILFSPQVYICTKATTRFKLQQLMKFNYINRERAF